VDNRNGPSEISIVRWQLNGLLFHEDTDIILDLLQDTGLGNVERSAAIQINQLFQHPFQLCLIRVGENEIHIFQCFENTVIITDDKPPEKALEVLQILFMHFTDHTEVKN